MPLMDGLTAAANIRHLSNADAKTIPIIAMTANAFDDDIEKSKAAGMNAHLTKPIEPKRMYPVSYTHLDVYKRQSPGYAGGGSALCFSYKPLALCFARKQEETLKLYERVLPF